MASVSISPLKCSSLQFLSSSQCYSNAFLLAKSTAFPSAKVCRRQFSTRMSLKSDGPSVAIVGVTGAVGQEFLQVIQERDFPYKSLKLLASSRSAGKEVTFEGRKYVIEELNEESFKDVDIALFSAGGSISKKFGPIAANDNTIVIDNSSAFRMQEGIPLIIPEVNADVIKDVKIGKGQIIANPNCSTIICLVAANPLYKYAKIKRMVVSTYQAASGAGAAAMEELKLQTKEVLEGLPLTTKIFNRQYAFNLFSHNSSLTENGYNEEEMKMVKETKKILNDADIKVTATCIRVPIMRAHAESINLEFEKPVTEEIAKEILSKAPGLIIIDDRENNNFPTPIEVSSKDDVAVGRIRQDISKDGNHGIDLFVCGDQIRKDPSIYLFLIYFGGFYEIFCGCSLANVGF